MEFIIQNTTMKVTQLAAVASTSSWIANNITTTVLTIAVVLLGTFVVRFNRYREFEIKRSGSLKRLPSNKLFGTIPAMVDIYKESPQDTHPQGTMTLLQRKHNLDSIFFLDAWPASRVPQMIITDPGIAAQVTQTASLPKAYEVRQFVEHLVGTTSLIFTDGQQWKKTRSLFNPGFALAHLMTLVPSIVDDTTLFCKILDKYAESGEVFQVEDAAAKLTIDIMGHVVLDYSLNSQSGPNDLVDCFRSTIEWTPRATDVNPFVNYNPLMPIMHKYYSWRMDNIVGKILDDRYASKTADQFVPTKKGRKPAIDLALDEYAKQEAEEGRKPTIGIDPIFKKTAIDSMKSFLFAGHDTSSSTVCFIYHCLSRHPEAAEKVRKEHDEVFGTEVDVERVAELIKDEPNKLNKLPYTLAVIKETLRLYPPASTVRQGSPELSVDYNGTTYPTDGLMVWIVSHAMHRRADFFPCPDEFIPERFLPVDHPDNYQEVPKDAWRPFEKGPRNCIGQELAVLEMKIIMVMTVRIYDVSERYKSWDSKLGRKDPGGMLGGTRGMFGDRVYQVLQASAKPADGFPGVVKRRMPKST